MEKSSSGKSPITERPPKPSFGESWRQSCRSFQVWAHCDDGHFNEVLLACWAFVLSFMMLALAAVNAPDSPEALRYLCLGALGMILTGSLGIHMMIRWYRWETSHNRS